MFYLIIVQVEKSLKESEKDGKVLLLLKYLELMLNLVTTMLLVNKNLNYNYSNKYYTMQF
jgi:hypothetical protein